MPGNRKAFWIGLLIYAVSFVLVASGGSFSGMPGYLCAFFALGLPIGDAGRALFHGASVALTPVSCFTLFISGCINPIFVITALLALVGRHLRLIAMLRVTVVPMIPFTWLFFATFRFYPREGYFLWVIGMLLVLFSGRFAGSEVNARP